MKNILLILIFSLSSCVTNSNLPVVSENTELTKTKSLKIDGFMFVKKGMLLNDIITYLDNNSIKHSKLINSENSVDLINYENMKYIDVYDYQIEDFVIDKFRISFIEDHVYQIKYDKIFGVTQRGNENNEEKVWNFYSKNNKVINSIFSGLEQKYGFGGVSNGNVSPVKGFSSNIRENECNKFEVEWNEGMDSTHNSPKISIRLGNSFCYKIIKEPVPFDDIEYYQYFNVHFTDKYTFDKIQENIKNIENKDKIKFNNDLDSIKKRKVKISEQL